MSTWQEEEALLQSLDRPEDDTIDWKSHALMLAEALEYLADKCLPARETAELALARFKKAVEK